MAFTLVMKTSGKASLHDFFVKVALLLVFLQISGIIASSNIDQENLSKAV